MKNTVLLQEFLIVVFSNLENIGATSNKWKKIKTKQLWKCWYTLANKSLVLTLLYYSFSDTKTNIKHYWFKPVQQKIPYGFHPSVPCVGGLNLGCALVQPLAECSETASIQHLCTLLKLSSLHLFFQHDMGKFLDWILLNHKTRMGGTQDVRPLKPLSSQHLKIRAQYCQEMSCWGPQLTLSKEGIFFLPAGDRGCISKQPKVKDRYSIWFRSRYDERFRLISIYS